MKRVVGGTTVVYIYSGSKVMAEYVNGTLINEYVSAGSQTVATVRASDGAVTYHHPDHLSERVRTDGTGALAWVGGHFPFGETWYEAGGATPWKFTSYQRDDESGLDYAMFRYDSTRLGRFMSPDPLAGNIANPQSLNRYSYVGNDPVNRTDPLGRAWCLIHQVSLLGWVIKEDVLFCLGGGPVGLGLGGGKQGGGGGGGNGRTPEEIKKSALNLDRLALCIDQIFGGKAGQLSQANAPALDTSRILMGNTSGGMNQNVEGTVLSYAGNGTVGIGVGYVEDTRISALDLTATYIHETGNILAGQIYGDPRARPIPDADRRDRVFGGDTDTGANLEDCVFGGQVQHNGQIVKGFRPDGTIILE